MSTRGKKGSSQDIAHSFHHSEKKVSMLDKKPIQIKSKHISGADFSKPSFHISVQGIDTGVLKQAASEVLGGNANKPMGLRNNKHLSLSMSNQRRFHKVHSSVLGPGVNKHHSLAIPHGAQNF
jgi:hypothetical protein